MILVLLHAAAALKHHFLDRSRVLARMWSGPSKDQ
jgi:cytochrome b561